ncbi:hypothetical protein HK100_006980 [Physocladia obscura]|uniref:PWWP domain-containing protein n=1 Tax=Physocladia obscura TaxID=109957 RepID=A0AAD5XBE3_9FUNG|nr:hypothetical protein HK100_006980 [Physocladia obscura]
MPYSPLRDEVLKTVDEPSSPTKEAEPEAEKQVNDSASAVETAAQPEQAEAADWPLPRAKPNPNPEPDPEPKPTEPLESMFDGDPEPTPSAENGNSSKLNGAGDDDDEAEEERLHEEAAKKKRDEKSHLQTPAKKLGRPSSASANAPPAKPPLPKVDYAPGMIIWAKVKGYPWWPGRIEHEDNLPENIKQIKPRHTSIPHEPIYFCGTRDYGWQTHDTLRPFEEFKKEFSDKGLKSASFQLAVREGNDPSLLNSLPNLSKKVYVPSSSSKKRKTVDSEADVETSDGDADPDVDKVKPKKKRSNIVNSDTKKAKTPKRKADNATTAVASADSTAILPPESVKEKKEDPKTPEEILKRLRSKLQNFLQNEHSLPEHFSKAEKYLAEVEQFQVDVNLLLSTKIGKVMRRISEMALPDDKFKIVERSKNLVENWKSIVDS